MDTFITIAQLIASLSILIVLHECGHFFPAKWFNTRVEKFYLFFDPWFELFKFKKGETEYGIGWLPLGGYVKISGMIDESFDKDQMAGPPQPWEFRSKKAWQRLIIMLGGVTVNFILGFLIFALIVFKWGHNYIPNDAVTNGIVPDSLGMELGLQAGDKILSVGGEDMVEFNSKLLRLKIVADGADEMLVMRNGAESTIAIPDSFIDVLTRQSNKDFNLFKARKPSVIGYIEPDMEGDKIGLELDDKIISMNGNSVAYFDEIKPILKSNIGDTVSIELLRSNDTINLMTTNESGILGINEYPASKFYEIEHVDYGFMESFPIGFSRGMEFLNLQRKVFARMFKGQVQAKESLGSIISIGKEFGPTWDWRRFWTLTASLSLLLAVLNLLPIPGLDGGYVMFLIYEVISGRKPSDKFMEKATLVGFILLVALMIYALGIDFMRHVF